MSYKSQIDKNDIVNYSDVCLRYALKNYKGLPRGLQNGVSSFNVMVSENVSEEAKEYRLKDQKNISQHLRCQLLWI